MTQDFIIGGSAKTTTPADGVRPAQGLLPPLGLGLGSCDRTVSHGGQARNLHYPQPAFADAKVARIQRLIAMQPNEFAANP